MESIDVRAAGYLAKTPTGTPLTVPATAEEDFEYFQVEQADEIRRYYAEHGYVVIRNLIPKDVCRAARASFDREVKPFKGFLYRQTTCNPERNSFSQQGFMMNPILNVQSLDARSLPGFRSNSLRVLAHEAMQRAVKVLLGEPGKIVQTMYFEGNPATLPHQDTYYLDAEEIGRMTAAWVAIEDIGPGAGRFFIYPKSHLVEMPKNGGDQDVGFNHAKYKQHVLEAIDSSGALRCRAPALRTGDVLFWAAKTIHGSLQTTEPLASRSSFTAHFIPEASRFLQWQSRIRGLDLEKINGINVHRPKNLAKRSARSVMWVEATFPRAFQLAKKVATKVLLR